jgi:hypothetical protein
VEKQTEKFAVLISDASITDDTWSDVFLSVAYEILRDILKSNDTKIVKENYLRLKNKRSKFRFMQVWSQFEDFKNFGFFISQISNCDVEISEVVFDNLRSWNLNKKAKLELLDAIKQIDQKSKLLDITIEMLNR